MGGAQSSPNAPPPVLCDIFISLRFSESKPQALALKKELAAVGISAYVCKVESGDVSVCEMHTCMPCSSPPFCLFQPYAQCLPRPRLQPPPTTTHRHAPALGPVGLPVQVSEALCSPGCLLRLIRPTLPCG